MISIEGNAGPILYALAFAVGAAFYIVNLILISVLVPRHALLGRLVQG